MPRNGSGVYSAPPNTLATTLTTIKSPEYNAFVNDLVTDANAARPVVAGGTGGTSVTAAQTNLSVVGYSAAQTLTDAQKAQARRNILAPYVAKSSGYTAVADDVGGILRFTNAQTLALTAAATLGDDWSVTVVADGGAVTIDPNASETINGLTTMIVPNGSTATIICDGTNFFTVIRPSGWQTIEQRTFSAASAVDFTNLGAFRRLRFTGVIDISATGTLGWRSSIDNGASFASGASDYSSQGVTVSDTTFAGQRTAAGAFGLFGGGSVASSINGVFHDFNTSGRPCYFGSSGPSTTGNFFVRLDGSVRNDTTARNAVRIFPTTALTITGTLLLEGSVS